MFYFDHSQQLIKYHYKYNINASISRDDMILMLNKMYPKVKKFSKFTVNTIKST